MILDRLENAELYRGVLPALAEALDFLCAGGLAGLPAGKSPLGQGGCRVIVEKRDAVGRAVAKREAHRKFIDVQYTLAGHEIIGWRPLAECHGIVQPYDPVKDAEFFADEIDVWLPVPPGYFAVFFPSDVHAPLAGEGPLHKIIIKVPVA